MTVINLRGRKPQVIPEGAVYIGRSMYMGGWRLPASKWANPYSTKEYGLEEALERYHVHLRAVGLIRDLHELRDKDLACWCAPEPCHGHLLESLVGGAA